MDTTFRGWFATLAAGVRHVISRLAFIFVLPLDFHGRVRVVRSMYLPAALYGVEASLLALDSLRKLRSSVCRVIWSRRQPFASVGAVLCLWDGLSIFSLLVLLRLVFGGILWLWLGLGPVCPCLVIWLATFSIFKAAILDAWRNKVAADLCGREGFRGGPLLDIHGSLILLMFERDKALLRSTMVGGV